MKKKSVKKIFFRVFIKTVSIILLLFLVAAGSYQATMMYYHATDDGVEDKDKVLDIISDVSTGDVSRNLIFSIKEEDDSIEAIVLEVFNSATNNLDYITIPANTQITISNDLYQRISVIHPEAPQIIQLSKLNQYFVKGNSYEYGIVVLEDLLGIDIGYYTAMDTSKFSEFFVASKKKNTFEIAKDTEEDTKDTEDTKDEKDEKDEKDAKEKITEEMNVYTLQQSVLDKLNGFTKPEELEEYIKNQYALITSNLKVKLKLKYLDALMNIQTDKVYSHGILGVTKNEIFTIAVNEAKNQYNAILNNVAYQVAQTAGATTTASSIGKSIFISNGSKINGLAAATKEKLVAAGYTVGGIGDYTGEVLEKTVIYVKKDGQGTDLLNYFKEAVIETKELEENIDIQIVLGTADAIQ